MHADRVGEVLLLIFREGGREGRETSMGAQSTDWLPPAHSLTPWPCAPTGIEPAAFGCMGGCPAPELGGQARRPRLCLADRAGPELGPEERSALWSSARGGLPPHGSVSSPAFAIRVMGPDLWPSSWPHVPLKSPIAQPRGPAPGQVT